MTPLLEVAGLSAGYGPARILFDVGFSMAPGEAVALLGRNGAGKSTLLKAIMGMVPQRAGRIALRGTELVRLPTYRIARLGLGYVPEERRIFADLSVLENLEVGRRPAASGAAPWSVERLFELFPNLAEARTRPGGQLSGGEQQMLALARTLMGNPDILLLDEPAEGLAPVIVDRLAVAVRTLRAAGIAILLAEQSLRFAAAVADRALLLARGRIETALPMGELMADAERRASLLAL